MEFGEKFKRLKGRVTDKARRVFGSSPSTTSPPNVSPSAFSPLTGSSSTQATPILAPGPASMPLTGTPAPVSVRAEPVQAELVPTKPVSTSVTPTSPEPIPATPISTEPVAAAPIPAPGPASTPPTGRPASTSNPWARLTGFRQILTGSSRLAGTLKPVIDDLSWLFETYEDAVIARQDYRSLKARLEELFSALSCHFAGDVPQTMTASMNNLCSAIEKELDQMSIKDGRGTGRRLLEAKKGLDEVMRCYRRIQGHLERLTLNADLSTWKIVDKIATDAALEKLKPSMSACYNSAEASLVRRRECTPETRKEVLAELSGWGHDQEQGNIYWLNGMAGTGKTTIATTLCAMLERTHDLGASFFCTRQLPECRNVKLILPTIAYQLACFSRPFRWALSRALESDPNVHTKALPIQLEGIILAPLREVAKTLPTDLVVVIDALDEVEDSNGVGQMLETLVKHASNLPVKVFVSSRPEPEIRQRFGKMKSQLVLHELDGKIVKGDIELYLRTELERISPSDSQLTALVERAGVLFIYAATVVRYIGQEDFSLEPHERLKNVLGASASNHSNQHQEIDKLYHLILSSVLDNPNLEQSNRDRIEHILHTVICVQEPLTTDALAGLLQLKSVDGVHSSLRRLWSVLHISTTNNLVSTLHASFPDYMLDPERSKGLGCDAETHHGRLAELCIMRVQNNDRQFNICELRSSYIYDEQVPDLEQRVNRAIPLDLRYACQYWASHFDMGGWSSKRVQLLYEFISTRLLLWMEMLNLTKRMNTGPSSLEQARSWCSSHKESSDTKDLIHDAWRFVSTFVANPVSRSTPHIYVSMLASWPRSRPVAKHYIQSTDQLVEIAGTALARRELHLLGAFATGSRLTSAALSPDGMYIVCGCGDMHIRIWDTRTGHMVLGPLEAHTGEVSAVAFSPDGMRIVSASRNAYFSRKEPKGRRIRVWDAQSGEMVLGPLEGHTDSVLSVAFSPDGMRIVSGSNDKTIRVWDTQSGHSVVGPLEGHTGSVSSVAFSPDGMRVISGSRDKTVRAWNARSGELELGPLEGHTGAVTSVAFSPDGMRFASGSRNNWWVSKPEGRRIRVWDAQSGEMMLGPLEGHTHSILSVSFSPDGMRIVSGSEDSKILVCDAQSGQVLVGPLLGHTQSVGSVAFSPDNMRIISASYDETIRVWDSQSERLSLEPLEGHSEPVMSIAFSPDGARIVSGSEDKAIRLWDVQSGRGVLGPLEGHAGPVRSVVFSPDGTRIVSGSDDLTIRMWDSQSGVMVLGPLEGHSGVVWSVAFSPDGSRIISSSQDKTILVWDTQSGQAVLGPLKGHNSSVFSVAFSPDGMRIVSGSLDMTIRVWDAQDGKVMLQLKLEATSSFDLCSVPIPPGGIHIVSGSLYGTIQVWDSRSGDLVVGPLEGHTGSIVSVAFSPSGTQIISGSSDKTIRVWDVKSGQMVLGPLKGHTQSIQSVAFSPDGRHIVSGSNDKTIRLWRMPDDLVANTQDPNRHSLNPPLNSGDFATSSHNVVSTPLGTRHPWEVDEDGWVRSMDQSLLLWVPHDLRVCLLSTENSYLISRRGSVQLTFDRANIGESWVECYKPS